MEYEVIRSNRKTISIQIKMGKKIVVRAPYHVSDQKIQEVVLSKENWIRKHLEMESEPVEEVERLSMEEIQKLANQALEVIPKRVEYYAKLMGVTYGRITIRNQRTRWGSCSAKGNLNFNCLLMLTPPEVIDSVVVHELCHRKEMNHSKRFYDAIYRVFPEYDRWDGWLKENGGSLMRRMFG